MAACKGQGMVQSGVVHADGSLGSDPWLDPGWVYRGGSFVEDPDTFGRTLQCSKVQAQPWHTQAGTLFVACAKLAAMSSHEP